MRKIGKRILSAALTFCMVVSMLAGLTLTTSAAPGTHATSITYCGLTIDEDYPYVITTNEIWENIVLDRSADGQTGEDGLAAKSILAQFDAATGTLTYKNGYMIDTGDHQWNNRQRMVNDGTGVYRAIKAEGDLTIDVGSYNNWFELVWPNPSDGVIMGIEVDGNLTFKGTTGSLRVNGQPSSKADATDLVSKAIYVTGDLKVLGGTLYGWPNIDWNDVVKAQNHSAIMVDVDGDIMVDNGGVLKTRGRYNEWNVQGIVCGGEINMGSDYIYETTSLEKIDIDAVGDDKAEPDTTNWWTAPGNCDIKPDPAFDPTAPATSLLYCGLTVNATNKYIMAPYGQDSPLVLSVSSTGEEQGKVILAEFDAVTGKLTYKRGYNIAKGVYNNQQKLKKDLNNIYRGIKATGSLIIDVGEYDNWFFVDVNKPDDGSIIGIEVSGNLKIEGTTGSLRVNGQPSNSSTLTNLVSKGVYVKGNLDVLGGTLYAWSNQDWTPVTDKGHSAILIDVDGNINVDNGGVLKTRSKYSDWNAAGIVCDGTITTGEGYIDETPVKIDIDSAGDDKAPDTTNWWTANGNRDIKPEPVVAPTTPATSIWYCGLIIDAEHPYIVTTNKSWENIKLAASSTGKDGETLLATFDATTGTLTYNHGYKIDNTANKWNNRQRLMKDENGIYRAIKADGCLTIDVGRYHIWFEDGWMGPIDGFSRGIEVDGTLTVKGEYGSIRVNSNPSAQSGTSGLVSSAVKVTGDLNVDGATLYGWTFIATYDDADNNYYHGNRKNNSSVMFDVIGDINVSNDGILKSRGKDSSYNNTAIKSRGVINMGEGYIKEELVHMKIDDVGDDTSADDTNYNAGGNLEIRPDPRPATALVGTALLKKSTPYLHGSETSWTASSQEGGAVAYYDADTKTLTFLGNADIKLSEETEHDHCIQSEYDLNIVIPEGVTVNLVPIDDGWTRCIYSEGDIAISGGGYLHGFAYKHYGKHEGELERGAVIWADGNITFDGITAVLNSRTYAGTRGYVIRANPSGKIVYKNFADVTIGTDSTRTKDDGEIGLLNVVPEIYDNAKIDVCDLASANNDTESKPGGDLVDYDPDTILDMEYLRVSPIPMQLVSVSGLNPQDKLPVTNPVLELTFNLAIANAITTDNFVIDGGATIATVNLTAEDKLEVTLGNIKTNTEYDLQIKNVANAAGLKYNGVYNIITSSGVDVGSIKLNGSEDGSIIPGSNSVSVDLVKAPEIQGSVDTLVTAVVWRNVTIGTRNVRQIMDVKSSAQQISSSETVTLPNITAQSENVIEVFVWNDAVTMMTISPVTVFSD